MNVQIPFEWHKYYETVGHFVTYYGDIYPGHLYEFQAFPDRVFIIPPINRKSVRELEQANSITLEALQQLGHEILDINIIRRVVDGKIGVEDIQPDRTILGPQHWTKMFVFGAGASSYCLPKSEEYRFSDFSSRPPIGNDLFSDRFRDYYSDYSGVRQALPSLKRFRGDVEAFLQSEWSLIRSNYNPNLLSRHIDILYYLQHLFFSISSDVRSEFYDCNLYSAFTDILQKRLCTKPSEKVAFVNFNYDTILDHCISNTFNVRFNEMADYVNCNRNPFLYFKPHGSADWGWEFKSEKALERPNSNPYWIFENKITFDEIYYEHLGTINEMTYARGWAYEGKFSINKNKIKVIKDDYPRRYFPALLVPYRDKDDFVMPYYHRDFLGHFMDTMDSLFLIGWKGNEASFNTLLKQRARNIKRIVIANPNPDDVKANLKPYLGELEEKYEVLYFNGFEDLIYSDLL